MGTGWHLAIGQRVAGTGECCRNEVDRGRVQTGGTLERWASVLPTITAAPPESLPTIVNFMPPLQLTLPSAPRTMPTMTAPAYHIPATSTSTRHGLQRHD